MNERRCILNVEKRFESGLKLPKGTFVFVEETEVGAIGSFYPDPFKPTSHVFALESDEYSYLVLSGEGQG